MAAGFFVSPANAKSLDDIVKDGSLRIGINPNSPPFSQRSASGGFEGFDVTIGAKIAEELKLKPEWVPTETAQRVPFLVADTIDISLGGLTRNSERAKVIEYTVPLHTEVMGVLTTDKNPVGKWQELNDDKFTLVDVRSAWTIDWAKENLPKAKMEIVDFERRCGARDRPGPRQCAGRDARLLHRLHQESQRREVGGARRQDRCGLGLPRRAEGQLWAPRCPQHHPLQTAIFGFRR